MQTRRAGETAIADADLAWYRRTAFDRFATVLVGQFQIGKPAASEIVDRMQPPTGGFGAGLAKAAAVAKAERAPASTHGGTGRLVRQLAGHHGVEELDRFVEPVFDAWIAHFGEAEHRGPGGGFAQ
jgi:hypothetical protein